MPNPSFTLDLVREFEADMNVLMAAIQDAMEHEVLDVAKEALVESAVQRVYDAYPEATGYQRRQRGGLMDIHNLNHSVESFDNTVTLTVSNDTPFQGSPADYTDLPTVITEGNTAFRQPFPRPFMWEGVNDVVENGEIMAALDRGLARHGF